MKRLMLLAVLSTLVACGGAGSSRSGGVIRITVENDIGVAARTVWDGDEVRIEVDALQAGPDRIVLLEHELWHAITGIRSHNAFGCVSYFDSLVYDPPLFGPCPEELAQVREALGPTGFVTISFPEDPDAAYWAAAWWIDALDRVAVRLAPDTVPTFP